MTALTPSDIAWLKSIPDSELQTWINRVAAENPELAAAIAREIDDAAWITEEKEMVAEHFGVAIETIDLWQRKGMPYTSRGKGVRGRYDLRECARWLASQKQPLMDRSTEYEAAQTELMKNRAATAELKRRQLERSLIDVEEMRPALLAICAGIEKRMEKIHRSYGNEVAAAVSEIAEDAIRELEKMFDDYAAG